MRVLLDTNVILDLFLEREPFVDNAALIWKANEEGRLTGYVSAITPVNLFYIGRKLKGRGVALKAVQELLMALLIAPVNQAVLEGGLALEFNDFEDAVQYASATASGLEVIVTRNVDDFSKAQLPVLSPADFIQANREIFEKLAVDANDDG